MYDPVHDRIGVDTAARSAVPVLSLVLCTKDSGRAVIASLDQLKNEVLLLSRIVIILRSGKHQSAERKTMIRSKENTNTHKERSNSPKERTSCIIKVEATPRIYTKEAIIMAKIDVKRKLTEQEKISLTKWE